MCQPSPQLHSVIARDPPSADGLAFDRVAKALITIASPKPFCSAENSIV
jgi:hypothetical protein